MFDAHLRPIIDPPLNAVGRAIAGRGIAADGVTLIGLALGLAAAGAIAFEFYLVGLVLIIASRVADGLDGAVARASRCTDFGGYLDITCDFLFYGAVPMAFVWANPENNALAGAWLLTSFYVNGSTFLGYAILAEKRDMTTAARGFKSLYFTGGLLEGAETIAFFVAICLFPDWFSPLAWVFGALCFFTAASRVILAWRIFKVQDR